MMKLDFKVKGYYAVPIHQESKRYLRFQHLNSVTTSPATPLRMLLLLSQCMRMTFEDYSGSNGLVIGRDQTTMGEFARALLMCHYSLLEVRIYWTPHATVSGTVIKATACSRFWILYPATLIVRTCIASINRREGEQKTLFPRKEDTYLPGK